MSTRTVHTGYTVGPTIPATEEPWPIQWERDPSVLACEFHEWESCLLAADGLHRTRVEEVVRCRHCHAPRCGHNVDADPCVMVRHHHPEPHVLASQCEIPWRDDKIAQHYGWVKGIPACTASTCPHGWDHFATDIPPASLPDPEGNQ